MVPHSLFSVSSSILDSVKISHNESLTFFDPEKVFTEVIQLKVCCYVVEIEHSNLLLGC